MGAIIKFIAFYLIIGFFASLFPIIFGKVKKNDIKEWIIYYTLFYPVYILGFLLKGFAIFYEKYIEDMFK